MICITKRMGACLAVICAREEDIQQIQLSPDICSHETFASLVQFLSLIRQLGPRSFSLVL